MSEEFKEIDDSYIVEARDRNLDADDIGETIFPLESFFAVFSQLAQSYLDGDIKVIQQSFAWLQSILSTVRMIPFDQFEELNLQQFFFDFFNTFEVHDFFPDALRVLNIFVSHPEFDPQMLISDDFFEILLAEVRPHLQRKSTAIELIAKLISGSAEAKENFLNNDKDNLDYLIGLYTDKTENDILQKQAIIFLFRTIINTPPLLENELLMPLFIFVRDTLTDPKEITEEFMMLFRDIIDIDFDYALIIMDGHDEHCFWSYLSSKDTARETKIIITEILYRLTERDYPPLVEKTFWPSITNTLIALSDEKLRIRILNIIKLIIMKNPISIIRGTDYKILDIFMNFAKFYQYDLKLAAAQLLAQIILHEDDVPCVLLSLVSGGYFSVIQPFLTTTAGPTLLKTLVYIVEYGERKNIDFSPFFIYSGILLDLVDNEIENEDNPDVDFDIQSITMTILSYPSVQNILSYQYKCDPNTIRHAVDSFQLMPFAVPPKQQTSYFKNENDAEDGNRDTQEGYADEGAHDVQEEHSDESPEKITDEEIQRMVDYHLTHINEKEEEDREDIDGEAEDRPESTLWNEQQILYNGDITQMFQTLRYHHGLPYNLKSLLDTLYPNGEEDEDEGDENQS